MRKVLSLDVSSSCIGIAILTENDDNSIILNYLTSYKPPKKGNILERILAVKEHILLILEEFEPDEVAIEDILLFMSRMSTAKTVVCLAIFNRTVGLTCLEKTNKLPFMYPVATIRATLKTGKERLSKEDMPSAVSKKLGIEWDWQLNRKGKPALSNFDRADSIAVGLCHILKTRKIKS